MFAANLVSLIELSMLKIEAKCSRIGNTADFRVQHLREILK
jgi:hypothetical protein